MKYGYIGLNEDKHFYSVPHTYIGKKVKVMYTRYNVEIFFEYERIALHRRSNRPYKYSIDQEHLPPTHRFIIELEPDRLLVQAEEIHRDVRIYIEKILSTSKEHKDQKIRTCKGVLDTATKVGSKRLIKACQLALDFGIYNYRIIIKILKSGLDMDNSKNELEKLSMPQHDNIRGGDYYK